MEQRSSVFVNGLLGVGGAIAFRELHSKVVEVKEVAYELLEDIENEWLEKKFIYGDV